MGQRRERNVVLAASLMPDFEGRADDSIHDLIDAHPGARLIREAYERYPGIDLEAHLANLDMYGFDPREPEIIQKAIDFCLAAGLWDGGEHRVWQRIESEQTPASVVYYMRLGNRVKVGTTTNVVQRLAEINPEELVTVELGGVSLERQRHEQFGSLRVNGEWFRMERPIVEHMRALAARFRTDFGLTLSEYTGGHRLVTGLTCDTERSHI